MSRLLAPLLALVGAVLSACAPLQQGPLKYSGQLQPGFSENWFTSFDGARLGLSTWPAAEMVPSPCGAGWVPKSVPKGNPDITITNLHGCDPAPWDEVRKPLTETVIVAVHGMNDYAGAFKSAGK